MIPTYHTYYEMDTINHCTINYKNLHQFNASYMPFLRFLGYTVKHFRQSFNPNICEVMHTNGYNTQKHVNMFSVQYIIRMWLNLHVCYAYVYVNWLVLVMCVNNPTLYRINYRNLTECSFDKLLKVATLIIN